MRQQKKEERGKRRKRKRERIVIERRGETEKKQTGEKEIKRGRDINGGMFIQRN